MKVAILGSTGMLGSMVLSYFANNTDFEIVSTSRQKINKRRFKHTNCKFLDATLADEKSCLDMFTNCDYIINCIGVIKPYINANISVEVLRALKINSLFPHILAKALRSRNTKIIQIATDCVYSGRKGNYLESGGHDAFDVYGKTKSLGEVSDNNFLNLRCSIIGPEPENKVSLLEWFLSHDNYSKIHGFMNHHWNGITSYHFAKICNGIIQNQIWFPETQHIVPANSVSKASLLNIFAEKYSRNDIHVKDFLAPELVDRTLATLNPDRNLELWHAAGYRYIPTIQNMVGELSQGGDCS